MANYVKNSDLLKEVLKSKEQGHLTDEMIVMINKMIKGCQRVLKYKDPEDKQDCMSFAMMDVIQYWNRFNPEKSTNAFSYFDQIIKNGLAKGWKKLYPIKSTRMIRISQTNGIYNI